MNRLFFRPWWVRLDHIGSYWITCNGQSPTRPPTSHCWKHPEPCLAMSLTNPGRSPAGKMTQKWQKWFLLFNLNLWKNAAISGPYHVKLSDDQSGWVPAFDFCLVFWLACYLNTFRNYQEMVPYNLKPIAMDRVLLQKWWLPGQRLAHCQTSPWVPTSAFPNHLWFPDVNFQVQPRGDDLCGSNYVSVFALSGSSIARDCCETGVFLSDPELGLHPNLVGSLMCIN